MIVCIGFLLEHVRSRDGAQDQENTPMSPDPFPLGGLGSGNETRSHQERVESLIIVAGKSHHIPKLQNIFSEVHTIATNLQKPTGNPMMLHFGHTNEVQTA